MRVAGVAVAAATAGLVLGGCELPEAPGSAPVRGTQFEIEPVGGGGGEVPPEVAELEPWQQDLYQEMQQPLPYNGGDLHGPCGAWGAGTRQDAEEMAAIHRRCLKDPAAFGMG